MATSYSIPGVYIEEVSGGARPIQAVGTSTAGFIGEAPDVQAEVHRAVGISSWTEFQSKFAPRGAPSTPLSQGVYGFFLNGGSRCYVVNVGSGGSVQGGSDRRQGLDLLEEVDDIAIVAAPGYSDPASHEALIAHCERLQDRVAVLDPPRDIADVDQLTTVARVGSSGEGGEGTAGRDRGVRPRQSDRGYAAFYAPWIKVRDPLVPSIDVDGASRPNLVDVPPSGHIVGIYARTDATRGVHKAPANEAIRGALDVSFRFTAAEQGALNPRGVNCIRFFAREGIRVWGARTLAPEASEWRYLNVRRLFNMIEESVATSTRWVVFEPNDMSLWKAIRRDVSAFLLNLWRDGALMGATPEEAFFIKCDGETNPPEVIDAGRVVTIIGLAPVKPAEFVIFRLGQHAGGVEVE